MSKSETDRRLPTIGVVIPALNEEATIADQVAEVLAVAGQADLPARIERVVVVDNGSADRTADRASAAGAMVVSEPRRGYGRACATGVAAAGDVDLIVQMDGDRSDRFDELPLLLQPLLAGEADLVIGSRTLGSYEPGSLLPQQRFGNWVAAQLLRLLYGVRVTDIGPFRVIRRRDLLRMNMREMTYGWSVEMIARAARTGLRVREVPVTYRKRAGGTSKVSGNCARLHPRRRADHRDDPALSAKWTSFGVNDGMTPRAILRRPSRVLPRTTSAVEWGLPVGSSGGCGATWRCSPSSGHSASRRSLCQRWRRWQRLTTGPTSAPRRFCSTRDG